MGRLLTPCPTVFPEQCAPIYFYFDLHCIELTVESLSPVLLHQVGQYPTTFFFDNVQPMSSTTGFTVVLPFRISINKCR